MKRIPVFIMNTFICAFLQVQQQLCIAAYVIDTLHNIKNIIKYACILTTHFTPIRSNECATRSSVIITWSFVRKSTTFL